MYFQGLAHQDFQASLKIQIQALEALMKHM